MKDNENITIIIATHNNATTIKRALESATLGIRPANQRPSYTFGPADARLPNVGHSSKDDNRPDSIETETVHDLHFENA